MTHTKQFRRFAADVRVWILTGLLLGSYAIGSVRPIAGFEALFLPAYALMYVYYVTIGHLFVQFGGVLGFWVGFSGVCWAVAVSLVWFWESVRDAAGNLAAGRA